MLGRKPVQRATRLDDHESIRATRRMETGVHHWHRHQDYRLQQEKEDGRNHHQEGDGVLIGVRAFVIGQGPYSTGVTYVGKKSTI